MTRSRPDTNDSSRQARTILLAADHQRMTGVVSPLKTRYHRKVWCQQVNNLAFTFIAPLGTENYD